MNKMDHKVESNPQCPICHKVLDMASNPYGNEGAPAPGDFTICLSCGAIMRFTDDMQFKICDDDDMQEAVDNDLGEKLLNLSTVIAPISQKIQQEEASRN